MLVLGRHQGEAFRILTPEGDEIIVGVTGFEGKNRVNIGIDADPKFIIHRMEVVRAIEAGIPKP